MKTQIHRCIVIKMQHTKLSGIHHQLLGKNLKIETSAKEYIDEIKRLREDLEVKEEKL